MKVIIINQIPEVNNKYTFSLARALINQGVNVIVCGISDDNVSSYLDIPYVNYWEAYSKKTNLISKVISYNKSWNRIIRYSLEEKVDIVHVQWYVFSPMDWYYHQKLRKNGIKVVTTIHDLLPFNKKIYDFFFHKKIYMHSDAVITQAQMNKEILIKKFCVDEEKIIYIPHGHYMEFADSASRNESREILNLSFGSSIILFFGQIKKVKGVDVLIKAMREVVDKHPDALCIIAGKVWKDDFSTYQEIIDELNLKDNIRADIRFIDDDEIKYYFNAADIVALPYLQIYQSGVVLLAYAYEKPVVATSEGEFLTVIKDKETGILVKAGDFHELADALNWYLDFPDKAKAFAEAGKRDISIRLGWDNISKLVKKVYDAVMM